MWDHSRTSSQVDPWWRKQKLYKGQCAIISQMPTPNRIVVPKTWGSLKGCDYLTACSTSFLLMRLEGSSGDVTTNQNDTLGVILQTTMFCTLVNFHPAIKATLELWHIHEKWVTDFIVVKTDYITGFFIATPQAHTWFLFLTLKLQGHKCVLNWNSWPLKWFRMA